MQADPFGIVNWALHNRTIHIITLVSTAASIAHTFLPPWDWNPDFVSQGLAEFPTAQSIFRKTFNNRWYRFIVYLVGWLAVNLRSTIWQFISVKNAAGPNANIPAIAHAINEGTPIGPKPDAIPEAKQ